MYDRMVLMPLGQLNTTPGTAPAIQAAPPAAAPAVAPATNITGGAAIGPAATTTAPGAAVQPAPSSPLGSLMSLLPIILMFVALYFFLFRGQRKEEKRRKSLIAELKKGDKIMTIGGMIANVVSIDGEEVVLKIDESANVKAKYRKSAIQEVLGGEDKK